MANCAYCGEYTENHERAWGRGKVPLCDSPACGMEFDKEESDTDEYEYQAAIDEVNDRFGRPY